MRNISDRRKRRVAFVWSQYAAYHVDRCEAVARALGDTVETHAVEVATTSDVYAWEPSGETNGCHKATLFPGGNADRIGRLALARRQFSALRRMDVVFLGLPYSRPEQFLLALLLRAMGVSVVMMNDSKFDDFPRHLLAELAKPVMMLPYHAALVAGARHADYLRFLGFRKRPVLQGYDTVSVDRLRNQVQADVAMPVPHEDRAFLFVGRFVPKKNIALLIEGYRRYVDLAGGARHPLILIGAGPLEAEIRAQISEAGLDEHILFPGFLSAPDVAATLAKGLALILPSREEQWGLVVNEALAMHLPVIVSENVGARDALVRNLVNGFVIEPDSAEGLSRAMHILSSSPETWQGMARESATLAPRGDTGRFVEAVAALLSTL